MKRVLMMSIGLCCAVVLFSTPVRAADEEAKGEGVMAKDDQGPGGPGMMGDKDKMKGMRGMMMHMVNTSMVATPDGGVIVLSGRTLTKYDKDLNVVKEVELSGPKPEEMKGAPEPDHTHP